MIISGEVNLNALQVSFFNHPYGNVLLKDFFPPMSHSTVLKTTRV